MVLEKKNIPGVHVQLDKRKKMKPRISSYTLLQNREHIILVSCLLINRFAKKTMLQNDNYLTFLVVTKTRKG